MVFIFYIHTLEKQEYLNKNNFGVVKKMNQALEPVDVNNIIILLMDHLVQNLHVKMQLKKVHVMDFMVVKLINLVLIQVFVKNTPAHFKDHLQI